MKILVTGASGYLGQGIVKHLLDNNHRVIAIGRKPERIDNRAERIAADISFLRQSHIKHLENQTFFSTWHGEMALYIIPMLILLTFPSTTNSLRT